MRKHSWSAAAVGWAQLGWLHVHNVYLCICAYIYVLQIRMGPTKLTPYVHNVHLHVQCVFANKSIEKTHFSVVWSVHTIYIGWGRLAQLVLIRRFYSKCCPLSEYVEMFKTFATEIEFLRSWDLTEDSLRPSKEGLADLLALKNSVGPHSSPATGQVATTCASLGWGSTAGQHGPNKAAGREGFKPACVH